MSLAKMLAKARSLSVLRDASAMVGIQSGTWSSMSDGTYEAPYVSQGRKYRAVLDRQQGDWWVTTHLGRRRVMRWEEDAFDVFGVGGDAAAERDGLLWVIERDPVVGGYVLYVLPLSDEGEDPVEWTGNGWNQRALMKFGGGKRLKVEQIAAPFATEEGAKIVAAWAVDPRVPGAWRGRQQDRPAWLQAR